MDSFPLCIVAIIPDRGFDESGNQTIIRPLRWAYFLSTDPSQNQGTLYELSGIRGSYRYCGPQTYQTLDPATTLVVKELGHIAVDEVSYFNELVEKIEIVNDVGNLRWSEGDWILTGVREFMEKGLIGPGNTKETMQDAVNRRSVHEIDDDEEEVY